MVVTVLAVEFEVETPVATGIVDAENAEVVFCPNTNGDVVLAPVKGVPPIPFDPNDAVNVRGGIGGGGVSAVACSGVVEAKENIGVDRVKEAEVVDVVAVAALDEKTEGVKAKEKVVEEDTAGATAPRFTSALMVGDDAPNLGDDASLKRPTLIFRHARPKRLAPSREEVDFALTSVIAIEFIGKGPNGGGVKEAGAGLVTACAEKGGTEAGRELPFAPDPVEDDSPAVEIASDVGTWNLKAVLLGVAEVE